jgi:histone H3/H4
LGDILANRKFSLYDIEQFIKEAGAEKVTEDAVEALERELSRFAETVTDNAIKYANHAKRKKLIKKSDIILVKHETSIKNLDISKAYREK